MAYAIIVLLAIACFISYFYVSTGVFAAFIVVWLAWSVYALFLQKKSDEEDEQSVFFRMRKNDKRHLFTKQINSFAQQDRWLDERMAVLKGFSENYASLAEDLKLAMEGNLEKANNYIRACDFNDPESRKKYTERISNIQTSNKLILDKINDLIEQLAEIENSADEIDTERIDDIIASLKEIAKDGVDYGK